MTAKKPRAESTKGACSAKTTKVVPGLGILAATGINPDLVVLSEPGTLLRTSSGKLRRKATLASYQAGKLVPPKKVNPWFIAGTLAKSALAYLQGNR